MDWPSLIGLAVALAMDAFAVSLAAGAVLAPVTFRHCFRLGFHFGLFQALMPVLGWTLGMQVRSWIVAWDHWIAFGLLSWLGWRMIREGGDREEERRDAADPSRGMRLVLLSIATSIDALAVGLSLAMIHVAIWIPALVIGLVACLFSVTGVLIGHRAGALWGGRVEKIGGLILIGIGLRILLSHLLAG